MSAYTNGPLGPLCRDARPEARLVTVPQLGGGHALAGLDAPRESWLSAESLDGDFGGTAKPIHIDHREGRADVTLEPNLRVSDHAPVDEFLTLGEHPCLLRSGNRDKTQFPTSGAKYQDALAVAGEILRRKLEALRDASNQERDPASERQ